MSFLPGSFKYGMTTMIRVLILAQWLLFSGHEALGALGATRADIASELPMTRCEEYDLQKDVRLYNFEARLFTTFNGKVTLMITGAPRLIGPVGFAPEVFGSAEGRPRYFRSAPSWKVDHVMAIPVKVCEPSNGYADALGFVLAAEWEAALRRQPADEKEGLPPSTKGNQIPQWAGVQAESTTKPLF